MRAWCVRGISNALYVSDTINVGSAHWNDSFPAQKKNNISNEWWLDFISY